MSIRRLLAVARKEVRHILRDPYTLFLVLLTPTLLMVLMAYALTVDIRQVPIAVLDHDRSPLSRRLIQQITAGDDLRLFAQVDRPEQLDDLLLRGQIKAAIVVGPAFAHDLLSLQGLDLQILIDGTEPESGAFAVDHVGWRAEAFIAQALAEQLRSLGVPLDSLQPIDLRVRALFNPALKPRVDMIPGLISLVLGLPALSVALALAHEHEHGTMEQLMATPIGRWELLLGKMLPYVLVGLSNTVLIPIVAIVWFDVPFHGSFPLFFVLSAVFLFGVLSMGILIGVFMRTQAAALALSFLLVFFPGFFLTGIFFPIASMPEAMRLEALALPGTHYAVITRGVFLTAVGMGVLWPYAVMLLVLGLAFTGIAALFFRKKLG